MKEPAVWGIHAGRTGDAHNLFLKKNVVALGWPDVGDLSKVPPARDAFKAAVLKTYPDIKPGALPSSAGQLYRFVHEMQARDIVVYPSKIDHQMHLGRVEGDYYFSTVAAEHYVNQRPVKWLKSLPRTHFTQGALYETGSALSLFQVKTYADEFLAAVEGKATPTPVDKDETVALVAEDIEQTTRDFIVKTLSQELKGHPFAEFVAHLLNTMGYRTRVSPPGSDSGVDIVAHRDELGFEPPIIKVQVKSSDGKVGDPEVSALYGKVGPNEHGLLVTLGAFTPHAESFAKSKSNLRLVDREELVGLILAHYEQLEARYKGILPLKKVYIPQPVGEEET